LVGTIAAVETDALIDGESMSDAGSGPATRGIDTRGRTLRAFAARGVVINTVFDVGVSLLGLIRGFVLAALLTRSDYGIWGVLAATIGVLATLKMVGIGDKYIQQEEPDQELAFQKAFTLELLVSAITIVPLLAVLPVVAVVYGHWNLVAPGAVLLSVLIAYALQAPFWIWYRKMEFARQRLFGLVEPLVGFVVAIVLAVLGAGYWALVAGLVAGAWAGAVTALVSSPYRPRWRFDRSTVRVYASYSGPVFIATFSLVVVTNAAAIAANAHLGLAGVGAIALSANITQFTTKVDDLVGGTLYPAICAVQNRLDLLRESFVKSNRLALMWAVPFGAGLALFAGELVRFGIGEKWHSAIVLLQVTGIAAAVAHVGWNWDDYFRARAETKPFAVGAVGSAIAFLGCLPLLFFYGLSGLAIAIAVQTSVYLGFRAWYLTQLFEGFSVVRHALRAILPTVPAVVAVLAVRAAEAGRRTLLEAIAELCIYVAVTVAATWLLEKGLLREAFGYLVARGTPATHST
jgi:O-antigen/teichoic acid export membrane protein